MEQSFPRTLEQLRHQHEADNLFYAVEQLLIHAEQPNTTETLQLFMHSPNLTQAVWKGEQTGNVYHRDTLGLSVFNDGLVIGIHPTETSQPRRHIAIGHLYANYSEYAVTRPGSYDHTLDSEHLERFSEHFELMAARLGLANIASLRDNA